MKNCVLATGSVDNVSANDNNIIFTIKDRKLYDPAVILTANGNQKLSKLFRKEFAILVYWNEYKTENENKNKTHEYRCFLESGVWWSSQILCFDLFKWKWQHKKV